MTRESSSAAMGEVEDAAAAMRGIAIPSPIGGGEPGLLRALQHSTPTATPLCSRRGCSEPGAWRMSPWAELFCFEHGPGCLHYQENDWAEAFGLVPAGNVPAPQLALFTFEPRIQWVAA